jgi:S1-C subfamily serine protease
LLLLLIPGVLVYPRHALHAPALDAASLGEAEDVLKKRVEDMRDLLSQGACRAPTNLGSIDNLGSDARARAKTPMSQSPDGASEATAPPAGRPIATSLMPPSPSALRPAKQTEATSVVDLVERATVLIIARTQNGETSTGTGFFVAPQRILTNRHVVENADRSAIYVTSKALASVKPVTLQAMTETSEFGSTDFALLDIQGQPTSETLSVTTASAKGDNVLAAGFPSVFMETDLQFQSLLQGQQTAAPQMVVTNGIVTVFQTSPSGVPLLLHSADISPGNSGGPLVDYCGRVVGVNTFLRTNTDDQMRLNFALKADSLVGFLRANQVPVDASTAACVPIVNAAAATPSTAGP